MCECSRNSKNIKLRDEFKGLIKILQQPLVRQGYPECIASRNKERNKFNLQEQVRRSKLEYSQGWAKPERATFRLSTKLCQSSLGKYRGPRIEGYDRGPRIEH